MQERLIKQLVIVAASMVLAASVQPVQAGDTGQAAIAATRPGDHPAVVVARMQSKAGYDYASKIYLHPARLALESVPPRVLADHPAVMVAKSRIAGGETAATRESGRETVAHSAATDTVEAN